MSRRTFLLLSRTAWGLIALGILVGLACVYVRGFNHGIEGGPNLLSLQLQYEDGSNPATSTAGFTLVNTISLIPFQSHPVSEERKEEGSRTGEVLLKWKDNSGAWLERIVADGHPFTREPASRPAPFWQGYAVYGGRAVAVNLRSRVTLDRAAGTFVVEHLD